ncbi:Phosphatidylinositol-glycan biosynthesis class F protein [Bagarius yarrelli]|uniref:Phosphatidylinositol-glycan biosynthesis class F protein n=1 Tax=Bagarius yarrelli TaxID=175774 RepID=A0A556TJE2_BAGYA|nr:Phosphatidylinositol-glycan biosynthesis class F protein [Bagarius yarrelli]
MWEVELRGMASAHALLAGSVLVGSLIPALTVENFSVFGTHLAWLYSVSGCVAIVNIAVFWLLVISPPTKRNSLSYKLTRLIKSCVYFLLSCFFFHTVGIGDVFSGCTALHSHHAEVSVYARSKCTGVDPGFQ